MKRREFLWTMGAGTVMLPGMAAAQTGPRATVLYDGRAIALDRVSRPPTPDALWIQKADLPRINGFELKPQGACREDICIPIPRADDARRLFQPHRLCATHRSDAWSPIRPRACGASAKFPVVRGAFLESRIAPDFSVPDRKGRPFRLSQFRGKKVLLVTWASW